MNYLGKIISNEPMQICFLKKIIRNALLLMIIWEKSLGMEHCRFSFLKSKSAMEHFS